MINLNWFFQGKYELFYFLAYVIFLSLVFWYVGIADPVESFLITLISVFLYLSAEKLMARKYGSSVILKINPFYLLFSLILAFFKIPMTLIGLAETYPYRYGRWGFKVVSLGRIELGYIGFAGAITTLGLAVFFKFLTLFSPVFLPLYKINAIISFYNLLFVPHTEGFKIYGWSPMLWVFLLVIAGFMMMDIFFVLGLSA
ncbi:MAG: hypothetical protein J7K98_04000 [Candidatus Aenigmarchaeota archaeon]|nr:hypothetical protein [Candidatus Aenigmarchaeota archaeon]